MRDILIKFLQSQLDQQRQMMQSMATFLAGLTGEKPSELQRIEAEMTIERSVQGAPTFFKDKYTSSDGMLRLTYSRGDPGAKQQYIKVLQGGDANSQTVSSTQSLKEEDECLKYLTKRADGRWMARKTINGERVCIYGKTQAECVAKLRDRSRRRPAQPKRSFAEFAEWWLKSFKRDTVSPKTYKGYKNIIANHLQIKSKIDKVTSLELQEILNRLPSSRIKEAVCQVIKAITRKAYELDVIKKDVGAFLEKGKIEKTVARRALTVEEQGKLVAALKDDIFSYRVMFYLCTGARPAELATVRKEELRPGWVKINGTKTQGATRWIKISDKLGNILKNSTNEFFNFDLKRFRERLQRFCSQIGFERPVDIYTLRHTFATNLYILRVPEKDRQTYMGHAPGSAMTNGVYTTFSPDTEPKDIYNIFGEWLPKF